MRSRYIDEVWVLSIPSFLWIAVNDTNNWDRDSYKQSPGRFGHTCTMWQQDQMIVVGGIDSEIALPDPDPKDGLDVCDPTNLPIRLLDTSTYSWQTEFIPNTTDYRVPSVVYQVIGGE